MSEQPTPPKPKPGSLRDRIAAFEKPSAAASGQPSGPPVPRPKPGGLSWKPKPPSPPPSPSISESTSDNKKIGGMSAIDAKESIGKGGSLKERMAALQNRGGFGAPPPIAPKPSLEKPKWKPPPMVAPIDKDDEEDQTRREAPRSPPLPRKLSVEGTAADIQQQEGVTTAPAITEGEEQAEVDPEEEERQRRTEIAARLARLGGTRVGMGPPVFGQKPPIKKPEALVEATKPETPGEEGEESKSADVTTSGNILEGSSQQSPQPEAKPLQPARQSSVSSMSLSPEPTTQQSRSPPTSMPLPAAPRRAGPPRKKSAKSPEIPPPTPPAVLGEDLVISPDGTPGNDTTEDIEKAHAGDVEQEVHEPGSVARDTSKDADYRTAHVDSVADEPTTQVLSTHEADAPEEPRDADVGHDKSIESDDDDHLTEPSAATEDNQLYHDSTLISDQQQNTAEPQNLSPEAEKEQVEQATDDLDEEDEETARRQRIAEKLAKMGGVNPLAMPPQRRSSASVEDAHISPTNTKKDPLGSPTLPPPPRRQSTRKSSSDIVSTPEASAPDETLAKSPKSPKSMDDSKPAIRSLNSAAPASVREIDSDIEELRESDTEIQTEQNTDRSEDPHGEMKDTTAPESEDISDDENEILPPPPPAVNRDTRPATTSSAPVDPALPVKPITSAPAAGPVPPAVSPETRPVPPPRLIPQPLETEEANDSDSNYSPTAMSPPARQTGDKDDEDNELIDHLPPRSVSTEETVEDDSSPLPVPHRRSQEAERDDPLATEDRSFPHFNKAPHPPAVPVSISDEPDSDFEEALPTRPLHRSVTPGTPPTNEIPLIVPPPAADYAPQKGEPSPLRQSFAPPGRKGTSPLSSGETSPSHLSVSDQEVLDEDEGDPIDPAFHSPSRRGSTTIAPPSPAPSQPAVETEEDEQAERRRTIAERMAKLGGIKFGAAPLQPPVRAIPKPREKESEDDSNTGDQVPVEVSEEEEERSRKERIAAKLAGMGGMRIGMLPPGFGPARPAAHRVPSTETAIEAPSRAVPPPSRAPPPPVSNDSDADPESSLSASQQSLSASDDGVKVEAEESEIEEVSHADAAEPEQEELPPPVPARGPRRQATGSESDQPTRNSSVPRPPVPTSVPGRRPSAQTITSITTRRSSADSSHSIPHKSSSAYKPQSEYVMVEEPAGFMPDDDIEAPPLPPARPSSRPPPPRGIPPPPSDSISAQWELPSIPTSSLEFSNTATDLSLSWPSDTNPAPSQSPPEIPHPTMQQAAPALEQQQHLSADDLIALWGRVGVQICEVATTLHERSKKSLIGDGSYDGFIRVVLNEVPNAAIPPSSSSYGYLIYSQTGGSVQKRASDIMPGDVVVLQEAKFKGHKGLHTYHQTIGAGEQVVGIASEFEPKKSKIRVFQANQHVGQQTVEAASYRLEDLKSGTVKIYRVPESK